MNTPSDLSNIIIDLQPLQVLKLELMRDAISEPTTYEALIDGLLDIGLVSALIQLLEEDRISSELCEEYASLLPDYLRAKLQF